MEYTEKKGRRNIDYEEKGNRRREVHEAGAPSAIRQRQHAAFFVFKKMNRSN